MQPALAKIIVSIRIDHSQALVVVLLYRAHNGDKYKNLPPCAEMQHDQDMAGNFNGSRESVFKYTKIETAEMPLC